MKTKAETTPAQQIRQILSREMNSQGINETAISPIVRTLIFTHSDQSDQFWTTTVPQLMIEWMPELKTEITQVLNPTITKFMKS